MVYCFADSKFSVGNFIFFWIFRIVCFIFFQQEIFAPDHLNGFMLAKIKL